MRRRRRRKTGARLRSGAIGGACSFGNAGLLSLGHMPIQRPGVVGQALKWMFDADSPLYIALPADDTFVFSAWELTRLLGEAGL